VLHIDQKLRSSFKILMHHQPDPHELHKHFYL
jgi:hypothetical protein